MSLLAPLGLLGLIGIVALIIIYIIKPNYQNKIISSTYIWKLSLRYRKKKIPMNKLRNILLFICQLAILAGAAFILTRPVVKTNDTEDASDLIIVIDASASMQTQTQQETRLERACTAALVDAKEAFGKGQRVSLILASDKSQFLVQEATAEQSSLIYDALADISDFPEEYYTFGTPDIDGAMKIAEQITSVKEDTSVTLYTDTTYLAPGDVKVHNVKDPSEWNAAILDVRATLIENLYRIEIDVACYAADEKLTVKCEILDIDGNGTSIELELDAYCSNDETTTLVLGYVTDGMSEEEAELIDEEIFVTQFDEIYVHVSEYDSLAEDNQFYLYGGKKPTIRVQYYSALPNTFWRTALDIIADSMNNKWNFEITEIKPGINDNELAVEGFDIYIFEHAAPTEVPDDGIVIYSDTGKLPPEAGVRFGGPLSASVEIPLEVSEDHPILKNIRADKITVTAFTSVISADGYSTLLSFDEYPLMLIKEDVDQKIILMPFSVHYSNLVALPEFPILLKNITNHFFRETVKDGFVYEPGESISLDARADVLEVTGPGTELTLEELPTEIKLDLPGTYMLTQALMSGDTMVENIYVKLPAEESDIELEVERLTNPYFFEVSEESNIDLLFYFALAIVALLFFEWWLKSREQI